MGSIEIFRNRLRIIRSRLTPRNAAEWVRLLSFIVVISAFALAGFFFFFRIFKYLVGIEVIGIALINKTIETAFFIFFSMLFFSNIVTSLSTFYRNDELEMLFAFPVAPRNIFISKIIENGFYASWATLIISLPLVLAFGLVMKVSFIFYPVAVAALLVFMVIPSVAGSTTIVALSRLFPRLKPREVVILSLLLIGTLSVLYVKANNPNIFKVFETENEEEIIQFVNNLSTVGSVYLPSNWLVNIIKDLLQPPYATALLHLAVLVCTSASLVVLAMLLADHIYRRSWLLIAENSGVVVKKKGKSLLIRHALSPGRAILAKDILTFIRDPSQSVQLLIFFALIIIYIFSLRRTPIYFNLPMWRTIIAFANLGYVSFVLATLGVRFIFPSISLEGEGIWLLRASPVTVKKIFQIKYLFNLVVVFVLIELLAFMCNSVIQTERYFMVLSALIFVFVGTSFVSINLGLGAIFPQFNEVNPSKVASGAGGVFAALASLSYVGILITILAAPTHSIITSHFWGRHMSPAMITLSVVAFIVLNFVATVVPVRFGIRSLSRREL